MVQWVAPDLSWKQYWQQFPVILFFPPVFISYLMFGFTVYIIINLAFPTILKFPYKSMSPRITSPEDFVEDDPTVERPRLKGASANDFKIIYEPEEITKTVVLAGSFNPPHNGHFSMIRFLAQEHKHIKVVVGFNPSKTYTVSPQTRHRIVETMCKDFDNVQVVLCDGLIWKYASRNKATVLYRGIRTWRKDGLGELFLLWQNLFFPPILGRIEPIPTKFLEGDPQVSEQNEASEPFGRRAFSR